MEWKGLARVELDEMIASGLQAMDDAVQAAWNTMRIEPEKWQCSRWGDESGGFSAVAAKNGHVVWYNDIEDPFGLHDFAGGDKTIDGKHTIEKGKSITFRYRVLLHQGDEKEGRVAEAFEEFAKEKD